MGGFLSGVVVLLATAFLRGSGDLASVAGRGAEAPTDWANLRSPETYLGSEL